MVEGHPFYLDLDLNWNPDLMQLFMEKTGVSEAKFREISLLDVKEAINFFHLFCKFTFILQLFQLFLQNYKNSHH